MAISYWDKPKIWKKALLLLAEEVDFGLFSLVEQKAYLDSLEQGLAIIGCKSLAIQDTFERKRLWKVLEPILSDICEIPVTVKFTHGRPRLIEKSTIATDTKTDSTGNKELAAIFSKYGDIMGIVDNHPLFKEASKPLSQGGWGIYKKLLTIYCKEYGVLTILTGLREVASKTNVKKPRIYFLTGLKAARWGHKLVVTPSLTGP